MVQRTKAQFLLSRLRLAAARRHLEKFLLRFPRLLEPSCVKELNRIAAYMEDSFIQSRPPKYLSRLACSIVLVKRRLLLKIAPLHSLYDIRILSSSLHFMFGFKSILGILMHTPLGDKCEILDEGHILLKIRKLIPNAQIVKDSIYTFQSPQNAIKTLYFEIDKQNSSPFSPEEIKYLKPLLKQEIRFCMEKLISRTFVARNEEEILKNIFILSREIHLASSPPEVMIILDTQTSQEAIFTVILVRVSKKQLTISEQFLKIKGNFTCFLEQSQIIRYLKKTHPIEANVFRIHLRKDSSFLRPDLSINFYLARQKITDLLTQAIGPFRDFNGGIILKQQEALSSFMEIFPNLAAQNPNLLEKFFYSINPIESQATLPIRSLAALFNLFIDAMRFDLIKSSDYFLRFDQNNSGLLLMIRLSDGDFKKIIEEVFTALKLPQIEIVSCIIHLKNSHFLGYFVTMPSPQIQDKLKTAITEALETWQQTMKSPKALKLGLEYPVVSLDPRIGGDQISSLLLKMLSEGLMRESKGGKIEYGIAKSVEISTDLKTYLFKLHPTRWSDGSSVTAFDFEYAWKKVLCPTFKTPFAYLFYPIKNAELAKSGLISPDSLGIQALNESYLKVELKSPTPYFLELTAHTIYSPVHRTIDQLHPNWSLGEGNTYVCNGAFRLIKNDPNHGYTLIKNPFYWDIKNIQLDRADFLRMTRHQALEAFQQNNNHWIGAPLVTWEAYPPSDENSEPINFPSKCVYWYTFNCTRPPFNNKKMRQAFSLAVDRAQLALLLNTQPIISPLPASHSLVQQSPLSYFNPLKAQALFDQALQEMALSKEDFPSLSLVYLPGTIRNKLAEMVKQFWETTFNIHCILEPLEWDILFSKLTEGNYQVGCMGWEPWVNDPMYTLNAFRDKRDPINFSKWERAEYKQILHLAERELEPQKRQHYYLQAEELLLDEAPVASICSMPFRSFKKKNLRISYSSYLINFKWARFKIRMPSLRENQKVFP